MTSVAMSSSITQRKVVWLEILTLAWMLIECSVALTAAWRAKSVSLLAFGSDSFVEAISAVVVLLQFSPSFGISRTRAGRLCGSLLFILAGLVACIAVSGLFLHLASDTSRSGIAITAGALLLMPVLASAKRNAAEQLGDKALRADAVQSATCAYLAALTLVGLLLHSLLSIQWLDQVAALAAVPILIVEAKRARQGHSCSCC